MSIVVTEMRAGDAAWAAQLLEAKRRDGWTVASDWYTGQPVSRP